MEKSRRLASRADLFMHNPSINLKDYAAQRGLLARGETAWAGPSRRHQTLKAALRVPPQPAPLLDPGLAVARRRGQPFAGQVPPDPDVQALGRGVLPARLDRRGGTSLHLGVVHVRVKEGAAIRRVLVDRAAAVEVPVAGAVGAAGGDQRGIRLV